MDHEARISELEKLVQTLATKSDIEKLSTKSDSDVLRAELKSEFQTLRADFEKAIRSISDIRTEIQKSITENGRWSHTAIWAIITSFLIGLIGLLFTIWNANKSHDVKQATSPAVAPIVIPVQLQPGPNAPTQVTATPTK
ncbi:CCDC90 family protein [Burkholderia sp. EMB26]|uniref:CCDC90 family protein n=1 Tax=Burkholderia sp. EMB26 TaxID=2854261 RepID=UPI00215A511A|nr:CCDC90 family protein [Burkholderia sp. EMB26]UVE57646.1 CCDC90 family protein [Burkholderia sp. EMB26]